jgi:SAM-dependent methyltransferase
VCASDSNPISGPAHDEENARIAEFYHGLVSRFGVDPRALDWGSRASQETRFDVLIEIDELAGRSVLDIGCGLADLFAFLESRHIPVAYTGYDIAPAVIRFARERFPHLALQVVDLMAKETVSREFDFVLASGIFNLRPMGSYSYLEEMVRCMFEQCRCGVAFNSLSRRSNLLGSDQFLADPAEVLRICLDITPSVVLRHDYMPHDFTVYLYKDR